MTHAYAWFTLHVYYGHKQFVDKEWHAEEDVQNYMFT